MENKLIVEVAFATPEQHTLLTLTCQPKSTVQEVLELSGLVERFPDLLQHAVGLWSKPCSLQDEVQSGDRIEVYRNLLMTPMEARLKRAQKNRASK